MAINYSRGLQGGLGGAASGAAIGSAVPGIGTAIGAGAGGLLGLLSGLMSGGSSKRKNIPQNITALPSGYRAIPTGQSQQQLDILSQLGPLGLAGIQQAQNIEPILQRARTQFAQQTVPSLAERFTSMGSSRGGALSSPAFASQLGAAGAGLEESLAALGAQHQQALLPLFMQILNAGLQPQYNVMQKQHSPGFGESLLGGTVQGASSLLPLLALLKSGQQSSQAYSLPQSQFSSGFGQFKSNPELQALLRSQGGFY